MAITGDFYVAIDKLGAGDGIRTRDILLGKC